MKIRLTNHAQYRILERGISVDLIKGAISNPDVSERIDSFKIRNTKQISWGTMVVVFKKKDAEYLILTAYVK